MAASSSTTTSHHGRSPRRGSEAGTLPRAAARTAAAILTTAFGFHLYWALGGTWGAATAYGSTDLPPRGVVAVVTVLIAAAALLILARVGALRLPLPARLLRLGCWALVAVFALAGLGNLAAPADSYGREWHVFFFGPLLLVLAIVCAVVARSPISTGRRP